jgi:hypothetical protein
MDLAPIRAQVGACFASKVRPWIAAKPCKRAAGPAHAIGGRTHASMNAR